MASGGQNPYQKKEPFRMLLRKGPFLKRKNKRLHQSISPAKGTATTTNVAKTSCDMGDKMLHAVFSCAGKCRGDIFTMQVRRRIGCPGRDIFMAKKQGRGQFLVGVRIFTGELIFAIAVHPASKSLLNFPHETKPVESLRTLGTFSYLQ